MQHYRLNDKSNNRNGKIAQRIVFVFAISILTISSECDADDFSKSISDISKITNQVSQNLPSLKRTVSDADYSNVKSIHDSLYAKKLELERLSQNLANSKSLISEKKSGLNFRKREWKSALDRYQRFANEYDRKMREIDRKLKDNNRKTETYSTEVKVHNADAANQRAEVARREKKLGNFNRKLKEHDNDLSSYDRQLKSHNRDADNQRRQVADHNADPDRTQAEADRLNAWKDRVNSNKARIDSWNRKINERANRLNRWSDEHNKNRDRLEKWRITISDRKASLDKRVVELDERYLELTADRENLIVTDGKKMLDLRLKASKKEREYVDLNNQHQKMQKEFANEVKSFNSKVSEANRLSNDLTAALLAAVNSSLDTNVLPETNRSKRNSGKTTNSSPRTNINFTPPTVNIDKPFDPRVLVSEKSYRDAEVELERLTKIEEKLLERISKLKKWKKETKEYRREFEQLRVEIARGTLSDMVSLVPIGKIAEAMSKSTKYSKHISTETADKVETAYLALKSLVASADSNPNNPEQFDAEKTKNTLLALKNGRDAMLKIPISQLPEDGQKWLKGVSKFYEVGIKILSYRMKQAENPDARPDEYLFGDRAELVADIASVFYPPLGIGLTVKSLTERKVKQRIIQPALDSLGASLSHNWQAQQHLREKLRQMHTFMDAEEEIVRRYESVNE